jgi:hypothetical protein|tara:strand:+ start:126 stop:629 length:504 start_codon:yes stop_codon:yes gene_type:complete
MVREWEFIKGYEGRYLVNRSGQVKSLVRKNPIILKETINSHGYCYVILSDISGNTKSKKIHRLVAETFIVNEDNKFTVNHIDGDKLNNYIGNLEWNTQTENSNHSFENGLSKSGEDHPLSKLSKQDVESIRLLWNDGNLFQKDIAKRYNTSQSIVSRIVNGKIWKHI